MSYNRPTQLKRAILSVLPQDYNDVWVFEDKAPRRSEVVEVVNEIIKEYPNARINLYLNDENVGYDRNLRNVFSIVQSDYCLIMGDDDILYPDAMKMVNNAVSHEDVGFVGRAWKEIDINTEKIVSFSQYYEEDKFFTKGRDTVLEFFRKSVFITGLVIHKESALKYATDKFDGTLLYQIYLLSMILWEKNGFYISNFTALRFCGGEHFFGSSDTEKDIYEIGKTTSKSTLNFMRGFIAIAKNMEEIKNTKILNEVQIDFSKNSLGFLESQRIYGLTHFLNFARDLSEMGYNKTIEFKIYTILLILFGSKKTSKFILILKKIICKLR